MMPKALFAVGDKGLIEHAEQTFGGIEALCCGQHGTRIQRLNLSGIGLTPEGLTRLAILLTPDTTFTAALNAVSSTGSQYVECGPEPITYTLEGLQAQILFLDQC
jgi:hypothetical protein